MRLISTSKLVSYVNSFNVYQLHLFHPAGDQPYAYQMVRTDAKEQKLDAFVVPKSLQHSDAGCSEVAMVMEGEKDIPTSSGGATGDRGGQPGTQDDSLGLQQGRLVYCF